MQIFFTPLADAFGWSRAIISGAFALQRLEGSILTPLEGFLVDRIGPRPVVITGGFLIGTGFILLSFTQNLWMFYVGTLIVSAGTSAAVGVPRTWAIVQWFTRMRGKVMGIGSSGAVISGPLLVIVVWLVAEFGWRQAFFILGIASWIIIIPLAFVYRTKPEDYGLLPDGDIPDPDKPISQQKGQQLLTGLSGKEAILTPTFWILILIFGLQTMPVNGLIVHLIPYLEGPDVGFSTLLAASVLGNFTVLSTIGRLGGGWITDYVDNRYVLAGLLLCQALGVFFLIQVSTYSSPDFWDTVPFAFFHGIAFGGMIPIRGILVSAYFGRKHFGFISGLTQSGSMIGGLVAPVLLGWVFDKYTTYVPALWVIIIGVCVAIPLSLIVRRPHQMQD
jgi:MFS family permease